MATAKQHNPIALLARQFKALMSAEANLNPEQRKAHQWQLLANHGKRTYIILKGGANTVGYKVVVGGVDSEWTYLMPIEMLDVLQEWQSVKYVSFAIVQAGKVVKKSNDQRELLQLKPKNTSTLYGMKPDGSKVPLFSWKTGVFNASWQPIKGGGK